MTRCETCGHRFTNFLFKAHCPKCNAALRTERAKSVDDGSDFFGAGLILGLPTNNSLLLGTAFRSAAINADLKASADEVITLRPGASAYLGGADDPEFKASREPDPVSYSAPEPSYSEPTRSVEPSWSSSDSSPSFSSSSDSSPSFGE
jgi:hypothetical protein